MSYPQPAMEREQGRWLPLSGAWEFQFDPDDRGRIEGWQTRPLSGTIRVPYCVESQAAGLPRGEAHPVSWYARDFSRKDLPAGERFFLTFGAVDYEADVWVNGSHLGGHRGGYTPFSLEITDCIREKNRIAVRVADYPTRRTLRGKQYIYPWLSAVFYMPVSGIWQPVFIFATGRACVKQLVVLPDLDRVTVRADIDAPSGATARVRITDADGAAVVDERPAVAGGRLERTFAIPDPRHWSTESPHLYRVELTVSDGNDAVADRVSAATGLRRVEVRDGKILLNGSPVYLKMLLVQGYYPGGHYTPTDEREFEREIARYKALGFNGIRMHEKVEDPRYLSCCDRHGLLLWEEMPSPFLFGGLDTAQYDRELSEVIARDACHPSVMALVMFNETWGIYDLLWSGRKRRYLESVYHRVKALNPAVAVVDNSGYDHVITDIVDVHHYLNDDAKIHALYRMLGDRRRMSRQLFRLVKTAVNIVKTHVVARVPYLRQGTYRGHEPFVVSEFGGAGYYTGAGAFMENFRHNVELMRDYPAITGYCLTQAYDVENEKNGLLNFDRSDKYPADEVRAINGLVGGSDSRAVRTGRPRHGRP